MKNEIDILEEIYFLPKRPTFLPGYYGFVRETSLTKTNFAYSLYFDFYDKNLKQFLESQNIPINFNMIKEKFINLVEGLAFLQAMGVAHRDIKPQNIMIDKFSNLKIIDFNCATRLDPNNEEGYVFRGTEGYLSPEWVRVKINNNNKLSEQKILVDLIKSDVFVLGLNVLEMGGIYKDVIRNYEEFEAFEDEVKVWIANFEQKFANSINESEENKTIAKLIRRCLTISYTIRPDFFEFFELLGIRYASEKMENNELKKKLKYHIFINENSSLKTTSNKERIQLEGNNANREVLNPETMNFIIDARNANPPPQLKPPIQTKFILSLILLVVFWFVKLFSIGTKAKFYDDNLEKIKQIIFIRTYENDLEIERIENANIIIDFLFFLDSFMLILGTINVLFRITKYIDSFPKILFLFHLFTFILRCAMGIFFLIKGVDNITTKIFEIVYLSTLFPFEIFGCLSYPLGEEFTQKDFIDSCMMGILLFLKIFSLGTKALFWNSARSIIKDYFSFFISILFIFDSISIFVSIKLLLECTILEREEIKEKIPIIRLLYRLFYT